MSDTIKKSENNTELDTLVNDAYQTFLEFSQDLTLRVFDTVRATYLGEIRLTKVMSEYAMAAKMHGFSQAVMQYIEASQGTNRQAAGITVKSATEHEKTADDRYRVAALNMMKGLRAEGFTTAQVSTYTEDLKHLGELARILGKAEAVRSVERDA